MSFLDKIEKFFILKILSSIRLLISLIMTTLHSRILFFQYTNTKETLLSQYESWFFIDEKRRSSIQEVNHTLISDHNIFWALHSDYSCHRGIFVLLKSFFSQFIILSHSTFLRVYFLDRLYSISFISVSYVRSSIFTVCRHRSPLVDYLSFSCTSLSVNFCFLFSVLNHSEIDFILHA